MKKASFINIALGCAACSIWFAAPVQADSQSQLDQNSQSQYSTSGEKSTEGKSWNSRSAHAGHLMRASRLTGCDVIDASGNRIGRIEDVIVNPASGRIDFAVLSLNAAGAASSPSGYNSGNASSSRYNSSSGQSSLSTGSSMNSGGTADTSSTSSDSAYSGSSGKLVPVPWSLLRISGRASSSSSASSESASSAGTGPMHTFTLNVDRSKLDQAPSLNRGNWSDMSQSNWREQIYTYYGVTPESAAGAAESPSGVSQGQGAEHLTNQEGSPTSSSQNP